jgi:S-DNA-T family DNA segregation ATPase FtsK/SpoIIIE
MDRRYEVLARNRVRKISDYLEKRKEYPSLEPMPYYVIVVDEFNDLVMQCGQDVNDCIVRLAQKARAAGMHVILATQRPTVDVVNGTIKANIPCRIAFRVASSTDSSTILDETGAESLLGRGDMLIKNDNAPVRAQGAYISDDEIGAVCDYICDRYDPDFMISHDDLKRARAKAQNGGGGFGSKEAQGEDETLLYEIAEACVQAGSCSINSIQSGFGIGFNRASRIVSILEERGVVSPRLGTKPREILVDSYKLREIFHVDE